MTLTRAVRTASLAVPMPRPDEPDEAHGPAGRGQARYLQSVARAALRPLPRWVSSAIILGALALLGGWVEAATP